MEKTTISAKISLEQCKKLNNTGYPISVIIQALIEMFLNMPLKEKENLIWSQTQKNIRERALKKHNAKG